MFQRVTTCTLFAVLCMAVCASTNAADAKQPAVPPQAKPFNDFLEAVKANDAAKFRDCQSKAIRDSNQDWAAKVVEAKRSLDHLYGNYDNSKFRYSFKGKDSEGELTIDYPNFNAMKLKVVKEGDEWKLASH